MDLFKSPKLHRSHWWQYLISVLLILIFVLPIIVLIFMAFKKNTDWTSRLLPPTYLYLKNFINVIQDGMIFVAIKNTFIIVIAVVLLECVVGALAAYPLARNQSKFNELVRNSSMAVMMIPPVAILVGVYSMLTAIHGISTYWSLIMITVAFGVPQAIYMYASFIVSVPRALDEAAAIDGANVFQTFFYIIFPQLKTVTVTLIILNGVGTWNDYLYPSYILQDQNMTTVVLLIKQFFGSTSNDIHAAAAVCVLGMLPVIILYLFLQKYIVQGNMDSAVK